MIRSDKFAVIQDAKKHIAAVGSKHWCVVRARHPSVSTATFWRAVRAAKADLVAEDMRIVSEQGIRHPATHLGREDGSGDVAAFEVNGVPQRIDFLGAYRELFADVGALREFALNPDGSIRSPMIFDRSIKRRMSLIAQSLKLSQQVYTVRNVQMFVDTLIDEIASESPELQRRVLARLRQLQAAADPAG